MIPLRERLAVFIAGAYTMALVVAIVLLLSSCSLTRIEVQCERACDRAAKYLRLGMPTSIPLHPNECRCDWDLPGRRTYSTVVPREEPEETGTWL